MNIEDIPHLPDRERRFDKITVDGDNEYEQLSAFEAYLTDALRTPFGASEEIGKRHPDRRDEVA